MSRYFGYSILLPLIIMGVLSCSKDDGGGSTPSFGKWTLAGQEYVAKSVSRTNDWGGKKITASAENTANVVVFGFNVFPAASGQYPIVEPASLASSPNGVSITIYNAEGTTQSYFTSTNGGASAEVTVNGGKVSISTPLFITEKTTDSTELVTASISNIQEQ